MDGSLTVTLNETEVVLSRQVNVGEASRLIEAQVVYIGGYPEVPPVPASAEEQSFDNRVQKRQVSVTALRARPFKGLIQDLRVRFSFAIFVLMFSFQLGEAVVEFYPVDPQLLSPQLEVLPVTRLENVFQGNVADDTCAAQPCVNNGTCVVKFWNDFRYEETN